MIYVQTHAQIWNDCPTWLRAVVKVSVTRVWGFESPSPANIQILFECLFMSPITHHVVHLMVEFQITYYLDILSCLAIITNKYAHIWFWKIVCV